MQLQTNFFSSRHRFVVVIDTGPWTLLQPQQTSHNSTSFVECQLASRQMSAVNHTMIHEEIQIEFSSHFTSYPYESIRSTSEGSYFVSHCRHHVINESLRGDSLCHHDVTMTLTNVGDCAARAMCLVITLTHMNYKLLVLYSICWSQIINYIWN